jgi:hypothetical protein
MYMSSLESNNSVIHLFLGPSDCLPSYAVDCRLLASRATHPSWSYRLRVHYLTGEATFCSCRIEMIWSIDAILDVGSARLPSWDQVGATEWGQSRLAQLLWNEASSSNPIHRVPKNRIPNLGCLRGSWSMKSCGPVFRDGKTGFNATLSSPLACISCASLLAVRLSIQHGKTRTAQILVAPFYCEYHSYMLWYLVGFGIRYHYHSGRVW